MRGFLDMPLRTDERTNERTSAIPLALIGVAERPKIEMFYGSVWKLYVKNFQQTHVRTRANLQVPSGM